MKYLIVQVTDYKGGEIGTTAIEDSVVECLLHISDYLGETYEEFIKSLKKVVKENSPYAGTDDNCFQIQPIIDDKLEYKLEEDEILEAIKKFTIEDYNKLKQKYEQEDF